MGVRTWITSWPVYRQLTGADPLGRGEAAESPRSRRLRPRTATAERVAHSVCPYCAVGCAHQRFAVFEAGVASTKDPRYVMAPQRERLRAADAS